MKKAMKKNQESGGPIWEVKLGRLDSLTASQEDSNQIMPSPRSNATYLIDLFSRFNLSVQDLVALSGSHSTGKGKCLGCIISPVRADLTLPLNQDSEKSWTSYVHFVEMGM
ncbi:hypothetical protein RND71_025236 [Anisodus tanguticus]|uniref:peroxidase n=1 Tax=Anisodus tanguticus TaxID=243964 RepID=A0AAE1RR99_9SOLA|nr:hypothetical protein RND71_025236 [Anisodus tanguticus]